MHVLTFFPDTFHSKSYHNISVVILVICLLFTTLLIKFAAIEYCIMVLYFTNLCQLMSHFQGAGFTKPMKISKKNHFWCLLKTRHAYIFIFPQFLFYWDTHNCSLRMPDSSHQKLGSFWQTVLCSINQKPATRVRVMIYPHPLRLSIFPTSDWGHKWTSISSLSP